MLPTPTSLAALGIRDDPNCYLCGSLANLEHTLSSCSVALIHESWRHGKVLYALADVLEKAGKRPPKKKALKFLNFVRAGEHNCVEEVEGGNCWVPAVIGRCKQISMAVSISRRKKHIATRDLRPDIVSSIWSPSGRLVILLKLRVEKAHGRKMNKYRDLVAECQQRGLKMFASQVLGSQFGSPLV